MLYYECAWQINNKISSLYSMLDLTTKKAQMTNHKI